MPTLQAENQKTTADEYDKLWKKVEKAESKGLTQEALLATEEIYNKAKQGKNSPNLIKAITHIMKYKGATAVNADSANIMHLELEIRSAETPTKQILQSMQAEMFWDYYQSHRWQILDRTRVGNENGKNFLTWDAPRFMKQIFKLYLASIENRSELQKVNINDYLVILKRDGKESAKLRPSIYDLLAHRALDFFMRSDYDITRPAYKYVLPAEEGLTTWTNFLKIQFETPDSSSKDLHAARIFQNLLRSHKDSISQLLDVDLKRLSWARQHTENEGKDTIYIKTLEGLAQKYYDNEVVAEVYANIIEYYIQRGENYNSETGDKYKNDFYKAAGIADVMLKRFPNASGTKRCQILKQQVLRKEVEITVEEIGQPNQAQKALLTYRNHFQWYARIVAYSEEIDKKLGEEYNATKTAKILASLAPLKSWEIELNAETDYRTHKTEIYIPEMPTGKYWLILSDNAAFDANEHAVAYTQYHLVSFVATTSKKGSNLVVYANDRNTGTPLQEVEIEAWEAYIENPPHVTAKTDANGTCELKMPQIDSYYATYNAIVKKGDESYNLILNQYSDNYREDKLSETVYFFTDRSIYRPGQTLYFKGICVEKNGNQSKVVPNKKTKITLKDVNGQEVSNVELVSNEYGSINGTFALPSSGLLGNMTLVEASTGGSSYFKVEEYKRPKFSVTLLPTEGTAKLGEKVTVKGNAMGFAGDAISGAEVKYRVTRNTNYPYWDMYGWWKRMPYSSPLEITNGSAKTDAQGNFTVDFTAIPDETVSKNDKPTFSYSVAIDVVDITGETHSANSSVTIGYLPYQIDLNLAEKMFTDKIDSLYIESKNLNGVAQAAQGSIEIYRLESPATWYKTRRWENPDAFSIPESDYRRNYPHDSYKKESDFHSWSRSTKAATIPFDTGKDKKYGLDFLKTASQGKYVLEAVSVAASGDTIKSLTYFNLVDKNEDKPAIPAAFVMDVNKNELQPGDTLVIYFSSSEAKLPFIFHVQAGDSVILHEYATLNGGKQRITIPIVESYRGGIAISAYTFCKNEAFSEVQDINIPWNNKKLKIEWSTFRNKVLPGAKEEWRMKITGSKSEQVAAEMVAAMYDASLDEFSKHSWDSGVSNFFSDNYSSISFETPNMSTAMGIVLEDRWYKYVEASYINYDELNWFGLDGRGDGIVAVKKMQTKDGGKIDKDADGVSDMMVMDAASGEMEKLKPMPEPAPAAMGIAADSTVAVNSPAPPKPKENPPVATRKNLQETAFFFPTLLTNEKGEIILSFTMPEALTKWHFMGFAHNKDMQSGFVEAITQTQKELMMQPSAPRFMRVGDNFDFAAKVTNLSESDANGTAELKITDALTGADVTQRFLNSTSVPSFVAKKGENALVSWNLRVPEGIQAVTYQVTGRAGAYADGEENTIPVVSNQIMVTESMPLWVKGAQTKSFVLENLVNSDKSSTLKHQQFTLEFTSNPLWYAVQALPYLMEYPHECSEQIFSRYYANALASQVVNSTPKIKQVFDLWKAGVKGSENALLSNLEKNQELKSALLSETPWVLNAQNETERKKRVALLFDVNKMANELATTEKKLLERQQSSGAFNWFPGMDVSSYITELIATGIGHLKKLGVPVSTELDNAMQNAVTYIDHEVQNDYKRMKESKINMDDNHLGYDRIQYLYMRSFYYGLVLDDGDAYTYYFNQAKKYAVQEQNPLLKGMLALILHRGKETSIAKELTESLRQNAVRSEEMGMYWKQGGGWGWQDAQIETQALLIEALNEIDNDTKSVEDMKVYLLKNKQTNDWRTTRATVEACNALLATNSNNWEAGQTPEIIVGSSVINPATRPDMAQEAGTGYFKTAWQASEIKPNFGQVRVSKTTEGSAWGAIYWQYFENMDKVKYAATPLSIKKDLFIERYSDTGPVLEAIKDSGNAVAKAIKQGDKIVVRVAIRSDREMDYVHLKDMRAAGFEPIDVISTYKYQGGLGYYQSTKDLATHFFFENLPAGTHVFEYRLRATHKGDYANGITTMQAMYAPEFTTHSEGIRVKVE